MVEPHTSVVKLKRWEQAAGASISMYEVQLLEVDYVLFVLYIAKFGKVETTKGGGGRAAPCRL